MSGKYHKDSDYPSVTQILSPYSGYDQVPPWNLEKAAERGRIVHAHNAAILLGKWAPSPPAEYAGYVESARLWIEMFVDDVILVEQELEDHDLCYCGHPDLCIRSNKLGGIILPDWKTPAALHRKPWGAQMAGYENLLKEDPKYKIPKVDRIGALRLSPEGKIARFDEFTENRIAYWAAFYGALIAHNFFNQP